MKPGPVLERAAHPWFVPHVFVHLKSFRQILGPENPSVVGQAALCVGPRIAVDQLPGRWNANRIDVEREFLWILHEMEKMRMAAAEFLLAVHAEGVVPDHPTAADQAQFALEDQLQFRCKIIPNRQPEGAGGLQSAHQSPTPFPGPIQVMLGLQAILVNVVFVTNIKRRIREGEVNAPLVDL